MFVMQILSPSESTVRGAQSAIHTRIQQSQKQPFQSMIDDLQSWKQCLLYAGESKKYIEGYVFFQSHDQLDYIITNRICLT